MESPQSTVIFGQRGVSRKEENYFAVRILNYILGGGGFQSCLYKEVREKSGLVYSIYAYLIPLKVSRCYNWGSRQEMKQLTRQF